MKDRASHEVSIKTERQARYLGIDGWKLHDGSQYATVIIDPETDLILRIQDARKADVVRNFIAHAGEEFMKEVKGIACDMNADLRGLLRKHSPVPKLSVTAST